MSYVYFKAYFMYSEHKNDKIKKQLYAFYSNYAHKLTITTYFHT